MLMCPIPRIKYVVCILCGGVTKWNAVGKHTCSDEETAVVTSEETMYELLAEDGEFRMIGGQGGADAVTASDVNPQYFRPYDKVARAL